MLNITTPYPDLAIVALSERIDAFNSGSLREAFDELLEQNIYHFVVDLTDVDFMDSAGMSVLVTLLKRSRSLDGNVCLVRPRQEGARRILSLTRLDLVFDMADSAGEAKQRFKRTRSPA